MKAKTLISITALSLLMISAGCGIQPGASSTVTLTTDITTTTVNVTSESEPFVALCKADLAKKTGANEADVKLISVEATEFSDASMDYPRPDVMYSPVDTPGYIIILKAGSLTVEYHADKHGTIATDETSVSYPITTFILPDTTSPVFTTPTSTNPADTNVPDTTRTVPSTTPVTTLPKITDTVKITPPPMN